MNLNNVCNIFNSYRFLAVWVLFLCFSNVAYTQTLKSSKLITKELVKHDFEQIFKKTYWNFVFRPSMSIQKGVYYKDDDFLFNLKPAPDLTFGWMINIGLPKHFFIQTGINYNIKYVRYSYRLRENVFNENIEVGSRTRFSNYNGYVLPIYTGLNIPIISLKNNFFIQPKIGLDINFGVPVAYEGVFLSGALDDPNTEQLVFLTSYYYNPQLKPKFSASFVAGIGFNYILKDQRIINFQIIGSYNPFIVDKGAMTFLPGTTQEKVIPFRNHFNSLGFEVNYLFSKRPNHISKRKRKQMEALKNL